MFLSLNASNNVAAAALVWTTVQARPEVKQEVVENEPGYYEGPFINNPNYQIFNETVKLIRFNKMKVPTDRVGRI